MEKVEYPAVLVLTAKRVDWKTRKPYFFGVIDKPILENDTDLERRLEWYRQLEANGAAPYTYSLASVDDAERVLAERRAEVEAEINFGSSSEPDPEPPPDHDNEAGDASTPPAPENPLDPEELDQDDTTSSPPAQIAMVVRYQGTCAAIYPTGDYLGATAELVEWRDGRNNRPPDKNVERLRLWFKEHGYKPDFPEWKYLDRGHGPRRRLEVYRLDPGADHYETLDWNMLRQYAKENPIPRLPENERLTLYKRKALAGETPFEACKECPLVQNCPHGWGACDRKRARAEKARRERERPKLFIPGLS